MNRDMPLSVRATECANGETWEFSLVLGDIVVESVFRTPAKVTPTQLAIEGAAALREMMVRPLAHKFRELDRRTRSGEPTW